MKTETKIKKLTSTMSFKIALVGVICLLLLIPAEFIKSLILEREMRNNEVREEISSIWGGAQSLLGPVISVPFTVAKDKGEEVIFTEHWAHFFPEELNIRTDLHPHERYRGIFEVIVFESEVSASGYFKSPDFSKVQQKPVNISWEDAVINFIIPENSSIRESPTMMLNGRELEIIPGSEILEVMDGGIHSFIEMNPGKEKYSFQIKMKLNGTQSFSVYPVGKKTMATIEGKWGSPSFKGSVLPDERSIEEDKFSAQWTTTHLNRNYPQQWVDNNISLNGSEFGVELLSPADHYQKSFRSVKYALMFISLTFLTFILIELLSKNRLHPIQYIMTGLALILFYTLLVSLAEQIGFNLAYMISAISVISLISYYIHYSFRKWSNTIISISLLSALYLYLFVILQMQDYALVFGSIGLFTALAAFMILTRNIKWYQQEENE